jgi:hypothetical protein
MDNAPATLTDIKEYRSITPFEPAKTFMKMLKKQGLANKLTKRGSVNSQSSIESGKNGQKKHSIVKHTSAHHIVNNLEEHTLGPLHETLSRQQMDFLENKAEIVRRRARRSS